MAAFAHRETGMRDLCLAGGVALNCVGNGRILREGRFEQIWIQPAAGDAGGRVGVALALWHRHLDKPRISPEWRGRMGAFDSGQRAGRAEIRRRHERLVPRSAIQRARDRRVRRSQRLPGRRLRAVAGSPDAWRRCWRTEKVDRAGGQDGWSSVRARSAARSIIGDARSPKMQSVMNLKIKFRESFRPFAPSVLREHVDRVVRSRRRQPVHAAGRGRAAGAAHPDAAGGAGPVGHRRAERAAIDDSGRHPRRLLGANPDRAPRVEPALLRHHRRLLSPHRVSGDREHVVQRPRRADRRARRRTPIAASCAPTWTPCCSAITCSRRISRRRWPRTTPGRRSWCMPTDAAALPRPGGGTWTGHLLGLMIRLALLCSVTVAALVGAEYVLRFQYRHARTSGNAGDFIGRNSGWSPGPSNSLGFREREIPAKSPQRYRIVVVGDSFTWGQGIERDERFSNRLERMLGPRYEVLNFGIPGDNMPEHLTRLEPALSVSPDFVLLQLYINDFETRAMARPRAYPLLPGKLGGTLEGSSIFYGLVQNQWTTVQGMLGLSETYVHYMGRNLGDPNGDNSREAFGQLREFFDRARADRRPGRRRPFPRHRFTRGPWTRLSVRLPARRRSAVVRRRTGAVPRSTSRLLDVSRSARDVGQSV